MQARETLDLYSVFKITARGGAAWNKAYVNANVSLLASSGVKIISYGDGESGLNFENLEQLAKTFEFTRGERVVFLTAHGNTDQSGNHIIDFKGGENTLTSIIFKKIRSTISTPMYLFFSSCYGGACAKDIADFPAGSIIFCTASDKENGFGFDGSYIASALVKIFMSRMSMDLGIYFFVHSYLNSHNNIKENTPALIVKGYGDIIQHTFDEFRRLKIDKYFHFHMLEVLKRSRFDWLRQQILAVLNKDHSAGRVVFYRKVCFAEMLADNMRTVNSESILSTGDNFRVGVMRLVKSSALVNFITSDEEQAISICKRHDVNNEALFIDSVVMGRVFLANYLVQNGLRFHEVKIKGDPLVFAVINSKELLESLLARGLDIKVLSINDQDSPLHRVTDVECAKLLLQCYANTNYKNKAGFTPIHIAIRNKDLAMFKLLYSNQSTDRKILSPHGVNYQDFAESEGCREMVIFIESFDLEVAKSKKREFAEGESNEDKVRRVIDTKFKGLDDTQSLNR